jgi:hypothetical protein
VVEVGVWDVVVLVDVDADDDEELDELRAGGEEVALGTERLLLGGATKDLGDLPPTTELEEVEEDEFRE